MTKQETVRFEIPDYHDREKMVSALIYSGYKVWIEKVESRPVGLNEKYFVCVEMK